MDANLASAANRFPVYFRAPVLLALVWILWGVNVWVFRRFHIAYADILNFDSNTLLHPKAIIQSGLIMIGLIIVVMLGFIHKTPFSDVLLFPSLLYLTMTFCLVMPMNYLHRPGRERLLANLARVVFPAATGVLFVEVLLGDVLTSISKVIADVEVTGCVLAAHMVTPNTGLDAPALLHDDLLLRNMYSFHEAECADSYMRPLVTSIPFLLRFRQCWVQYRATGKAFPHVLNCAKYASSLPVIWISALTQRSNGGGQHMSRELKAAWIFAVSLNSFFSFMWDIVMDWGLCRQGSKHFLLREQLVFDAAQLLESASSGGASVMGIILGGSSSSKSAVAAAAAAKDEEQGPENEFDAMVRQAEASADDGGASSLTPPPASASTGGGGRFGFRPHLVYYAAIALNFVLRILWSFKLSVHFQLSQEGLTFVLEVCEVIRRFIWILFRVEWEAVEKGFVVVGSAVPAATPPLPSAAISISADNHQQPQQRRGARTRLDWGPASSSAASSASAATTTVSSSSSS